GPFGSVGLWIKREQAVDNPPILWRNTPMMLLRGKGQGLEIGCSDRDVATVCADLRARLTAQPDFYRGSRARAIFGEALPSETDVAMLRDCLAEFEIVLDG